MDIYPPPSISSYNTSRIDDICASLRRCSVEVSVETLSESQKDLALRTLHNYLSTMYSYSCRTDPPLESEHKFKHRLPVNQRKGHLVNPVKPSSRKSFSKVPSIGRVVDVPSRERCGNVTGHQSFSSAPLQWGKCANRLYPPSSGVTGLPECPYLNPQRAKSFSTSQVERGKFKGSGRALLDILEGFKCFLKDVIIFFSAPKPVASNNIRYDNGEMNPGGTECADTPNSSSEVFVCRTSAIPFCETFRAPVILGQDRLQAPKGEVSSVKRRQAKTGIRMAGHDLQSPLPSSSMQQGPSSSASFQPKWEGVLKTGRVLCDFVRYILAGGAVVSSTQSARSRAEGAPGNASEKNLSSSSEGVKATPLSVLAELRCVAYTYTKERILDGMQAFAPSVSSTELDETTICHAALPWWLWSFAAMGLHEIETAGEGTTSERQCLSCVSFEPFAFLITCTDHLLGQYVRDQFRTESVPAVQHISSFFDVGVHHESTSNNSLFPLSSNQVPRASFPDSAFNVVVTEGSPKEVGIEPEIEVSCECNHVTGIQTSFKCVSPIGRNDSDGADVAGKLLIPPNLSRKHGGNSLIDGCKSLFPPSNSGDSICTQATTTNCMRSVQFTPGDTTDVSLNPTKLLVEGRVGKHVACTLTTSNKSNGSFSHTFGSHEPYSTTTGNCSRDTLSTSEQNFLLQQKSSFELISLFAKANSENVSEDDCEGGSLCFFNSTIAEDAVSSANTALNLATKLGALYTTQDMNALLSIISNANTSKHEHEQFITRDVETVNKSPKSHIPSSNLPYSAMEVQLPIIIATPPSRSFGGSLHDITMINTQCKGLDSDLSLPTGIFQAKRVHQVFSGVQPGQLDDFMCALCSILCSPSILVLDARVSLEMTLCISLRLLNYIFAYHFSHHLAASLFLEPSYPPQPPQKSAGTLSPCPFCFLETTWVCIVKSLIDSCACAASQALSDRRQVLAHELIDTLSLLEVQRFTIASLPFLGIHSEGLTVCKGNEDDGSGGNPGVLNPQKSVRVHAQSHAAFLRVWLVGFKDVSETSKHLLKCGCTSSRAFETTVWYLAGLADYLIQVEQCTWKLLKGSKNSFNDNVFDSLPLIPLHTTENALFEEVLPPDEFISTIVEFMGTLAELFTCNIPGETQSVEDMNGLTNGSEGAEDSDDEEIDSSPSFIYRSEPKHIPKSLKGFRSGHFHKVKLCMHYFLEIIDVLLRCSINLPEKPLFLYALVARLSCFASAEDDELNDSPVTQQQHNATVFETHPSDPLAVAWHRALLGENSVLSQIHHFVSSYSCAMVQKLLKKTLFPADMGLKLLQNKSQIDGVTGSPAVSGNEAVFFPKYEQLDVKAQDKHDAVLFPPGLCPSSFENLQLISYNNSYKRMQDAVSTMCWPTESFKYHCHVRRILEHAQIVTNFLASSSTKVSQSILENRDDNSAVCSNEISRTDEIGPVLFAGVSKLLDIKSSPCSQVLSSPYGGPSSSILLTRGSFIQDRPSLLSGEVSDRIHHTYYTCLSIHSLKRCLSDTCNWLWLSTCLIELLSSAAVPINLIQGSNLSEIQPLNRSTTSIKDSGVQEPYRILALLFQNTFSVLQISSFSTYVRLLFLRIVHVFYFTPQYGTVDNTDTEGNGSVHSLHQYSFYQPLYEYWQRYCESLLRALRVLCSYNRKAHHTAHMLHIPCVLTRLLLSLSKEKFIDTHKAFFGEKTFSSYLGASLSGQGAHSGVEPRSGKTMSKRDTLTELVTFSGQRDRCGPKTQGRRMRPVTQGERQQKNSRSGMHVSANRDLMFPFSSPACTLGTRPLNGKDLGLLSPFSTKSTLHVCKSSVSLSENSSLLANTSVLVPKLQLTDMAAPSYFTPLSDTQVLMVHTVPKASAHSYCGKSKKKTFDNDNSLGIQHPPSRIAKPLLAKDTHAHTLIDSDLGFFCRVPLYPTFKVLKHSSDYPRQSTKKDSTCDRRESRGGDCTISVSNDSTTFRRPIIPPLFDIATHVDPASTLLSGGISSSNRAETFSSKRSFLNYNSGSASHILKSHDSSPNGFIDSTFSTAAGITLMSFPSIVTEFILCISSLVLQRESGFVRYDFTVSSMQNRLPLSYAMMQPENLYCSSCPMDTAVPTEEWYSRTIAAAINISKGLDGLHVLSDLQCYLGGHYHEPAVRGVNSWLDKQYGKILEQLSKVQLLSGAKRRSFFGSLEPCAMSNDNGHDSYNYMLLHPTDALLKPFNSGHYTLLRLLLPRRVWLRNFLICRRIGAGGFGSVYSATPLLPRLSILKGSGEELYTLIDRQEAEVVCQCTTGNIAIKLIPVSFRGGRSASLSLCHSEVLALHRLRGHPHIISLLSYGCSGEEFFIMTPEYTGGSLQSWRLTQYPVGFDALRGEIHATAIFCADNASPLQECAPSSHIPSFFSQCASIFTQVLTAVEFTHRHNIRHGDLKAGNVFIDVEQRFTVEIGDYDDPNNHGDGALTGGNMSPQKISMTQGGQTCSFPTAVRLGDFGSCDSCNEEDIHILLCDVAAGEARFMASRWGCAKGTEAVQPPEVMIPRRRYQIFRGILNKYFSQSSRQKSGSVDDKFDYFSFFEVPGASTTYSREHFEEVDSLRVPETSSKLKALLKCMQRVELSADIWSCGCLLYELLTGCMLFGGTRLGNLAVLANATSHTAHTNNFSCHGDTAAIHMVSSYQSSTTYCEASKNLTHDAVCSCTPHGYVLGMALNEQEQHDLTKSVDGDVVEFLCQLLSLDPLERPTASEALYRWKKFTSKMCLNLE
ncbi:unnamed protein product [Phytomonas sp. Hart1]|nr:unnamed protein product [Phytomonas sp. Hart1]|eukprot:CCW66911.1 unnamed protein product [Phytomonas sp. isolate Hart1]